MNEETIKKEFYWALNNYEEAWNYYNKIHPEDVYDYRELSGEESANIAADWKVSYCFVRDELRRFCNKYPDYEYNDIILYAPNGESSEDCITDFQFLEFLKNN